MAIKHTTYTCDHCEYESDEFEDEREPFDFGWFVLQGPDYILGTYEQVFCSKDCLLAAL